MKTGEREGGTRTARASRVARVALPMRAPLAAWAALPMRAALTAWVALSALALLAAGVAESASAAAPLLEGRLSAGLYVFEQLGAESGGSREWRAYQSAQIGLLRLGSPRLSLHLHGSLAGELRPVGDRSARVWIYGARARYDAPWGELNLGRQAVWSGVAMGRFDGLRWRRAFGEWVAADLCGGIQAPLDVREGWRSWHEGHFLGAQLESRCWRRARIALSFVEKLLARERHEQPGVSTEDYWLAHDPAPWRTRMVGLDGRYAFASGSSLAGRADVDLLRSLLQRITLDGAIGLGRARLSATYTRREPRLDTGSVFSVFDAEAHRELTGRVRYRLGTRTALQAHWSHVFFRGADADRVGLHIQAAGGTLGVTRSRGYAGERWGLTGDYRLAVHPRLDLRASSSLGRSRYAVPGDEWEASLVGAAGVTYRATRALRADLEIQGLQNRRYDADGRLLVRLTYELQPRGGR